MSNSALTPIQQAQILAVLADGCDRETAANTAGISPPLLGQAIGEDPKFAAEVRRREAGVEHEMMKLIYDAAREEKSWRTAVWWLEQRSPERFASRGANAISARHLRAFVHMLRRSVHEDIHDAGERQRVLARYRQIQQFVDSLSADVVNLHDPADAELEFNAVGGACDAEADSVASAADADDVTSKLPRKYVQTTLDCESSEAQ